MRIVPKLILGNLKGISSHRLTRLVRQRPGFPGAGFDESAIELLVRGLLQIARTQEVVGTFPTVHGQKFVLEGELEAPSGRRLRVRTIWIIDRGQERPRLVTAYPG